MSERTVQEIIHILAEVIQADILAEYRQSDHKSIMLDETTDVTVVEQLIMYGRYLTPDNKFHADNNINIKKLRSAGTDGAAVMTGKRNGFVRRLQDVNPTVTGIHCCAHRLALAAGQAGRQIPYVQRFKDTLRQIFEFYENSAVRLAGLRAVQGLLDDPKVKPCKAADARWLSIDRSCNKLNMCINSVIVSLEQEFEERNDARAGEND
ncbi:zinc finger protein 862-like [Anneissia japonica]|uniref:zinc finger protein 862-like n=1 Tax=Anneissia japonica TaxID=1529436 RepID=UPI0014259A8F|nr:zinc finger protein 862-like [Anneissia japonica]